MRKIQIVPHRASTRNNWRLTWLKTINSSWNSRLAIDYFKRIMTWQCSLMKIIYFTFGIFSFLFSFLYFRHHNYLSKTISSQSNLIIIRACQLTYVYIWFCSWNSFAVSIEHIFFIIVMSYYNQRQFISKYDQTPNWSKNQIKDVKKRKRMKEEEKELRQNIAILRFKSKNIKMIIMFSSPTNKCQFYISSSKNLMCIRRLVC